MPRGMTLGSNVMSDMECLYGIENRTIDKCVKKMWKLLSYTHKGVTYERSLIPVEVKKLKKLYQKIVKQSYKDTNDKDDFESIIEELGQSVDQYYKAYIDPYRIEEELRHFQNLWKHITIVQGYKDGVANSSN